MRRRFNSKEAAERHLEWRRNCAYKRIEKSGDTLLSDGSFISYDWVNKKFYVMLMITTQSMINDLEKHRKETVNRWEKIGLLEGLDGDVAEQCAQLFENQLLYMIKEEKDGMDS
jgi:hypothetical protein